MIGLHARRLALLAGVAVHLAGPIRAQELLHALAAPAGGEGAFGYAVAGVGDLDGDGRGDLLVGASSADVPGFDYAGLAFVFSGATGERLLDLASPNPGLDGEFGAAVSGVPDLDGDSRDDLLVGAALENGVGGRAGRAYVFSGATGALLHALDCPNGESFAYFGLAVSGVPDLDGDGRGDLLVGASNHSPGDSPDDAGRAYVFSGTDGALLHTLVSPHEQQDAFFGRSVSGVPDVDGDGHGDLLVGAHYENVGGLVLAGRAYLFSGSGGALLRELTSPNAEAYTAFGASVSGMPDADGDGRGDLLVGAPDADPDGSPTNAGRAYLFSGATGLPLRTLAPAHDEEFLQFGHAVSGVPDVDGDGRTDLVVGSGMFNDVGRAYGFSGASGALLYELLDPDGIEDSRFGQAVAGVPDANGDGRGDVLVGAFESERAYLLDGAAGALTVAPERIDFGLVPVGQQSAPEAVTIAPAGAPVTVTDIGLQGDTPDEFEVVSAPSVPFTLQPGESATVTVRFAPAQPGLAVAALVVTADVGSEVVTLTGVAPGAAPLVVTTTADTFGACDADCSLREALAVANALQGPDVITFDPALAGQTIAFADGASRLLITDNVKIDADSLGITVDARQQDRVFEVRENATFIGLTITGGDTAGNGGGLYADASLTLTLQRCTLTGNVAGGDGGGLYAVVNRLVIQQSTFSDNVAGVDGGGVLFSAYFYTVRGSTFSGNSAGEEGGGVHFSTDIKFGEFSNTTITGNDAGEEGGGLWIVGFSFPPSASSSVIAGNTVGGSPTASTADCYVSFAGIQHVVAGTGTGCVPACCGGGNNAYVAPSEVFTRVLSPALAHNGGPTRTHALHWRDDNPSLDLGGSCGPVDQRGFPAPRDGPDPDAARECDAGAVEQREPPALSVALAPLSPPVVIPEEGGSFRFAITVTNGGSASAAFEAWTEATYPDGTVRRAMGPVRVALGPGEAVERTLKQRAPGALPPGAYTYTGYVGRYPNGAVASDAFAGTKEGAAGTQGRRADGTWSAAYDGSEAPVTEGDVWTADGPGTVAAPAPAALGQPSVIALRGPRPNPFAGRAVLAFDLPEAAPVRLAVYDVLGREVAVLADGERGTGRHEAILDGAGLSSGVYLVRLEAGEHIRVLRATVVR